MSDVAVFGPNIEANEALADAYQRLAAATQRTVEALNRFAATVGPDGLAEMRAYERRWRRYRRTAHPGKPRRPYRHGRVSVR